MTNRCARERPAEETSTQAELEPKVQWTRDFEFLLSCVSTSVGLGNVWRFPFTAYENGGGAFLIPYIIVLAVVGRPLYYMELCMGQFSSSGIFQVWNMVPAFRGIGYAQLITILVSLSYFVVIISIAFYYFCLSFASPLPWTHCGNAKNTTHCIDSATNLTLPLVYNDSVSAAERFYTEDVLNMHQNGFVDGLSPPSWKLSLCLLLTWMIVLLIVSKGVRSFGKAVYFTALFPYLVLFILLGKAVSLPGAFKGLMFFITPQWEKLLEPKVWYEAIGQCFFSLSVSFGVLTMLSSHNNFRRNIFRDAVVVSVVDTLTAIICGCLAFAVLGYLAEILQIDDISAVIKGGGATLVFITYPDVLGRFEPMPQFFSVMFFLMLISTGLGSVASSVLTAVSVIQDNLVQVRKIWISIAFCFVGFLAGLFYVTPQGQYILVLVDHYIATFLLLIVALLELVAVQWVYGYRNFTADIEFMLKRKTHWYFGVCWVVLSPVVLLVALISMLALMEPPQLGTYVYGTAATAAGILLDIIVLSTLLLEFFRTFFGPRRKADSIWRRCFSPMDDYGPKDNLLFKEYQQFKKVKREKKIKNKECLGITISYV